MIFLVTRTTRPFVLAGVVLAVATAFIALRTKPEPQSQLDSGSAATTTASSIELAREPQSAPARGGTRAVSEPAPRIEPLAAPKASDEAAFMTMLRDVGLEDPEGSLQLAREGDARFPDSPGAAERGWYAVRALVNLQRMDEAVAKSRGLVDKYPDSPFALDVARHMLTHPMRDAMEVGQAEHR